MKEDEPWGHYCSACNPTWYTEDGDTGVGPRPEGHREDDRCNGKWHGKFRRLFLQKGAFHTNEDGNLAHIITLDTDVDKYALEMEDRPGVHVGHPERRLPRPGSPEHSKYLKMIAKVMEHGSTTERLQDVVDDLLLVADKTAAHEPRQKNRSAFSAMALAIAMGAIEKIGDRRTRVHTPPRDPTSEEKQRWSEQEAAKIAKAEAKRQRKAEKRHGR